MNQTTTIARNLTISLLLIAVMVLPCTRAFAQKGLGYSKERPLIVGLDTDFAPLQYVDDEGIPRGYDVDFTKMLMKRMGIVFTYAPNTWEKISGDVLHGRVDLGMMIYSDYRKDITNYSRPVFRMYYQIVYRKDDESTFNQRNLRGKHIAYMSSRPVGEMLDREGAVRTVANNLGEALSDLSARRYDAVICFRYQARYFIDHYHLDDLMAEDFSLQPREYCYVSHSKELIAAINAELKKMEDEGIIDDLYDIKSDFGAIRIPNWVWYLLASLVFIFLSASAIIFYMSEKRLKAEHEKLLKAYDLLAEKNDALVVANERAEESLRMKTNFIRQISHEIRTPLNILSGFTQIIVSEGHELDQDALRDIGERISANTERITGLVSKMLELSEASSMTVIERTDRVSLQELACSAIAESGAQEAAHVRFRLQLKTDDERLALQTNGRMVSRALSLLLDNALKFTKEGTVTLIVEPDGSGSAAFIVEDTGIGIPEQDAEHVFDEFVQLDDYYEGTGIGLTVARSIARRLGGDIVLDTSYTAGARFIFTLPLADLAYSNYENI